MKYAGEAVALVARLPNLCACGTLAQPRCHVVLCYVPRRSHEAGKRLKQQQVSGSREEKIEALRRNVGKWFQDKATNGVYKSIAMPGMRSEDEIKQCKQLKQLASQLSRDLAPAWNRTVQEMDPFQLLRIYKRRTLNLSEKYKLRGDTTLMKKFYDLHHSAKIVAINGIRTFQPNKSDMLRFVISGGRQDYNADLEPTFGSLDKEEAKFISVPSFNKTIREEWIRDEHKDRQSSKMDALRDARRCDWDAGYTAR